MKHNQLTIATQSRYIDRVCPITRRVLHPGDQVIICDETDTVFLAAAFREHIEQAHGRCPSCGNLVGIEPATQPIPATVPAEKLPPVRQQPYISKSSGTGRTAVVAAVVSFVTIVGVIG